MRIGTEIILLTMSCAIATSVRAADRSPDALTPSDTVDAFHEALEEGSAEQAKSWLDPQIVIMESGETQRSVAEYASHHLAADIEFSKSVDSKLLHRAVQSTNAMACVASEYLLSAKAGAQSKLVSTETVVMQRRADRWQIVHIHWSSKKIKD